MLQGETLLAKERFCYWDVSSEAFERPILITEKLVLHHQSGTVEKGFQLWPLGAIQGNRARDDGEFRGKQGGNPRGIWPPLGVYGCLLGRECHLFTVDIHPYRQRDFMQSHTHCGGKGSWSWKTGWVWMRSTPFYRCKTLGKFCNFLDPLSTFWNGSNMMWGLKHQVNG